MSFLLIDDNPANVDLIRSVLLMRWPESPIISAPSLDEARRLFRQHTPDIVLTEAVVGGEEAHGLIGEIREASGAGVIVVSSRGEEIDRVHGLQAGADDYVTKPYSTLELLARVGALLRRARALPRLRIEYAGLAMDFVAQSLARDGRVVQLTPTETAMFYLLLEARGSPVPAPTLATAVRGPGASRQAVKVHIQHLRRKLQAIGGIPQIATVPGAGYALRRADEVKTR